MQSMPLQPALARTGWTFVSQTSEVGAIFRSLGFRRRLLVTFDALSDFNHGREKVSGDLIASECEADHLHICTSLTNWYQSSDIVEVIEAANKVRSRYEEAILYGHSMGGYCALLLSGPLAATNVVAFVPQYSVDGKKVSFETRFNSYIETTKFVFDDMDGNISRTAPKHIVFDPHFEIDRKHFDLFAGTTGIVPVPIPFAGHYPGQMLKEGGILRKTIVGLLLQSRSTSDMRKEIRAARRRSHRYFLERAMHVARRGSPQEALRLVNIAYILQKDSSSILETFQALLHFDTAYYGVAHAMLRLLIKERADQEAVYGQTRDMLWRELEKHARKVIDGG